MTQSLLPPKMGVTMSLSWVLGGVKHRAQPTAALSKQDLNESVYQASEDPETREVGFGGLGKERAKQAPGG